MSTSTRDREPRWTALLELLGRRGRLTVAEASEELGVSPATVRRDFAGLAQQQLVTRTHGAVVATSVAYSLPARYRETSQDAALGTLAERAASLVEPGSVVGINGGRTTTAVARALGASYGAPEPDPTGPPRLRVVTNAINIASELALRPGIRCLVLGGVARPGSYEMTGDLPAAAVHRLWLDTLVLGVEGFAGYGGATCGQDDEAAINAAMVQRAARVVVVADGDKIGRVRMARICDCEQVSVLVTDRDAPDQQVSALEAAGVEVLRV